MATGTLPLAISFFTFQQISFLVDRYKNKTTHCTPLEYSLFVTFFPQLIAGPIVHWSEMMPQFKKLKKISIHKHYIYLFIIGLSKKVLIADVLSTYINYHYAHLDSLSSAGSWYLSLFYTFQLYFDFSGYCDMAMASAGLLGINLPLNFNSPYKSLNIQDFWRRWHMTLSRWLRDYIYIPLGGNRSGSLKRTQNIFITFLIGGLWHGAGWGFIMWGAAHGTMSFTHQFFSKSKIKVPNFIAWFITFFCINLSWVLFRAKTLDDAALVFQKMFDFSNLRFEEKDSLFLLLSIALIIACKFLPNSTEITERLKNLKKYNLIINMTMIFFFVSSILILNGMSYSPFIYFNF